MSDATLMSQRHAKDYHPGGGCEVRLFSLKILAIAWNQLYRKAKCGSDATAKER